MENNLLPQAVEIVKQAMAYDTAGDYENALVFYRRALEYFVVALKYESNPSFKATIMSRVEGYMKRAEQLKEVLDNNQAGGSSSGGLTKNKQPGDKDEDEKAKMRGGLSSAIMSEKPNVKWDDVAGLEMAKEALKEAVILPVRFPQFFTGKRKPWKGILLYGPPGTGKSYLAKAVATEADATFFAMSSSDLVSKWQGESEKLVRNMFEMAREAKPAIIFIDEIDSLCTSRSEGESDSSRRIKTEFLVQMDGVGHNQTGVLVLGATNVPWELDPAMRRRFDKRVYIALPEAPARKNADFDSIANRSEGYSGSDIAIVVREALMEPLRKCQAARQFYTATAKGMLLPCEEYPNCPHCPMALSTSDPKTYMKIPCKRCGAIRISLYDIPTDKLQVPPVTFSDFEKALCKAHSSVAQAELQRFVEWTEEFGEEG